MRSLLLLLLPAAFAQIPDYTSHILTPAPAASPRINGPKVYGARPGHPFLYRIPATGDRPMTFSAKSLPSSLKLDPATGIISGATPAKAGRYAVTLTASNSKGKASRPFTIVAGDTIALTPPMGWNDWYTFYHRISDSDVRAAADAMVTSGMADYGYSYVSIDDCWMNRPGSKDPDISGPERDSNGVIQPNKRFPDMKALTAYIHQKGLKAGIYTSPGTLTCARYTGSWQHEEKDAKAFADWGFDLLKYDWCSYGRIAKDKSLDELKKPYALMGPLVAKQPRDIQFNLCQYGMGDVWKWGAEVGGQSWRSTGDLGLEKATDLPGFYSIGFKNAKLADWAGPGRWNDPDYILIGVIGNAFKNEEAPSYTTLTPDEQYSYMSMWSLMASPLFFSGDVTRLDAFTKNVLCNAEVIDVNQDTLGKQARLVRRTTDELILAKPLENGALAVGIFNLTKAARRIEAGFSELGLSGKRSVRDLWRQKDLASAASLIASEVGAHGVVLLRLD